MDDLNSDEKRGDTNINLRISAAEKSALRERAAAEQRSLSSLVKMLIRKFLEQR